jgi:hypothetical protein
MYSVKYRVKAMPNGEVMITPSIINAVSVLKVAKSWGISSLIETNRKTRSNIPAVVVPKKTIIVS